MPHHGRSGHDANRPVTVGIDGSDYSLAAAGWAAAEAHRSGVPLHLLAVIGGAQESELAEALAFAQRIEEQLRASHPGLPVKREVRAGNPAHELLTAARDSMLLVTGSRGRGGVAGLPLGSVSMHLAADAPCPVVIVPKGHGAEAHTGPTVVGVNTQHCVNALRFGLAHAQRVGAALRVVHAWMPYPAHSSDQFVSDTDIMARQARTQAAAWVNAAHPEEFDLRPEIEILRGRAGEVLAEQSLSAGLVVVTSRRHRIPGRPGISRVVHDLVADAHSPIALVPKDWKKPLRRSFA